MSRLSPYKNTAVTIVKITQAAGGRSEVEVPNVPAAVFRQQSFVKTPAGGYYISKTFVVFEYDVDITGQDEIIIDGIKRPVGNIERVRKSRYSTGFSHLEIELG